MIYTNIQQYKLVSTSVHTGGVFYEYWGSFARHSMCSRWNWAWSYSFQSWAPKSTHSYLYSELIVSTQSWLNTCHISFLLNPSFPTSVTSQRCIPVTSKETLLHSKDLPPGLRFWIWNRKECDAANLTHDKKASPYESLWVLGLFQDRWLYGMNIPLGSCTAVFLLVT